MNANEPTEKVIIDVKEALKLLELYSHIEQFIVYLESKILVEESNQDE